MHNAEMCASRKHLYSSFQGLSIQVQGAGSEGVVEGVPRAPYNSQSPA